MLTLCPAACAADGTDDGTAPQPAEVTTSPDGNDAAAGTGTDPATDGESETDAGSTTDNDAADTGDGDATTNTDTTNEDDMTPITITVNGASFDAQLASTPAAQAFARMLPLSLTMDELNGNEKYHYLDTPLPAEAQSVGSIATGDLMLYGSSCVVLFYDSFRTSYTYTRLGRVADPAGLADALGSGSVTVTFEAA